MAKLCLILLFLIPGDILAQPNKLIDVFDYPSPVDIFALKTNAPTKTITKRPTLEEAQHYIHFCAAAYSIYDSDEKSWNCTDCLLTGPDVTLEQVVVNSIANTMVMFNLDRVRQEIIVTYRGTINLANLLLDIIVVPFPIKLAGGNGREAVYFGFYMAADSLFKQTQTALRKLVQENPGFRVVFTGHSMGSAVAVLNAFRIRSLPEFANLEYTILSYGQPRTGNKAFADYVNAQNVSIVRVVGKRDPGPHFPLRALQSTFIHHQNEMWLVPNGTIQDCSTTVYEDPNCSNSLGPFFDALDHAEGYFNTSIVTTVFDNWCPVLAQLIVNFPELLNIDPLCPKQ